MKHRKEFRLFPGRHLQAIVHLGSDAEAIVGTVTDLSGRGLGLQLPQPIDPGTAIDVLIEGIRVAAKCRYCAQIDGDYHVGLTIQHSLSNLKSLRAWNSEVSAGRPIRPRRTSAW